MVWAAVVCGADAGVGAVAAGAAGAIGAGETVAAMRRNAQKKRRGAASMRCSFVFVSHMRHNIAIDLGRDDRRRGVDLL